MRAAVLSLCIALGGCNCQQTWNREDGTITAIVYVKAHEERRCSKGCRYYTVPDAWHMTWVSHDDGHTHQLVLGHMPRPWEGQRVAARIQLTWSNGCTADWRGWRMEELKSQS